MRRHDSGNHPAQHSPEHNATQQRRHSPEHNVALPSKRDANHNYNATSQFSQDLYLTAAPTRSRDHPTPVYNDRPPSPRDAFNKWTITSAPPLPPLQQPYPWSQRESLGPNLPPPSTHGQRLWPGPDAAAEPTTARTLYSPPTQPEDGYSFERTDGRHSIPSAAATNYPTLPPNIKLPPPNPPPPAIANAAITDPPRPKLACTFCRARKLRCDGSTPCRHCERRSMDCIYAPTKGRSKPHSAAGKPSVADSKITSSSTNHQSLVQPQSLDQDPHNNRSSLHSEGKRKASASSSIPTSKKTKSQLYEQQDPAENDLAASTSTSALPCGLSLTASSTSLEQSGIVARHQPVRSAELSLAMVLTQDVDIPRQIARSHPEIWWDHLLSIFGGSRAAAVCQVRLLLRRFMVSNAIFFGLLHAPTMIRKISSHEGLKTADPALYFAVLSVAACDMHLENVPEPYTADLRAADARARSLSLALSNATRVYLNSALISEGGLTPSLAQATSIFALVQPDGSHEQKQLIRATEDIVRTLSLDGSVSSRAYSIPMDVGPDSALYWQRPMAAETSEAEVKFESLVRLCWTASSHRMRRVVAFPDEDMDQDTMLDCWEKIRPMEFWQPSILPQDLPPSFFHSQDIMRKSVLLSRLALGLWWLDKSEGGYPDTTSRLEKAMTILEGLDSLESSFARHRPMSEAEMQSILGRTVQMFCRLHVWARLALWRKTGLWTRNKLSGLDVSLSESEHDRSLLPFEQMPPTINMWIRLFQDMVGQVESDFDAHIVSSVLPRSTLSQLDSLIRHSLCALDILEATNQDYSLLLRVSAAIRLLNKFVSLSQHDNELPDFDETILTKIQIAEFRLTEINRLRSFIQDVGTWQQPPSPIPLSGSDSKSTPPTPCSSSNASCNSTSTQDTSHLVSDEDARRLSSCQRPFSTPFSPFSEFDP